MQPRLIHSSIDEGIDRKQLMTLARRFMLVNQGRLARTRMGLNRQQQIFFDILPMLFHSNHPMLPGYVSHDTPRGVSQFIPTKADVQRTQRLALSFIYRHEPNLQTRIHGIYLMGSCGTIGQSGVSDLDLWLCHDSSLNRAEINALRKKCTLIEKWATSLALEVHFFLMDDDEFRDGKRNAMDSEDCGTSQHYLLLDEFYRTGLLVAGRYPIWWLIPGEEENHYAHIASTLKQKRFIKPSSTVDFGGIPEIPAGEYIGAGIWQLYKAIDSPYKSVLKLLLIEVYASEYPHTENLSTLFKAAIHNERLDIDELDPYVMIYRKLEAYLLKRNEQERLELVRRCFYFKVGKKLSQPSRNRIPSWQRNLMQRMVAEWGWSKQQLYHLDNRKSWRAGKVIEERKALVRELNNSYRFLTDFARRTRVSASISSQEMHILGRKLYAAFERKAGKVELINPGIVPSVSEEVLSFCEVTKRGQKAWAVYAEPLANPTFPNTAPLKSSKSLIELMAWCHFNTLMESHTQLDFNRDNNQLSDFELGSISRTLQQYMPVSLLNRAVSNESYSKPAVPIKTLLFVNVAVDPMENFKQRGLHRISSNTDSLGYSGLKENLIINIEKVSINSWHEISCQRYDDQDAVLKCIKDYLETGPHSDLLAPDNLEIKCFCASRAPAIAQRVEELFHDVITHFSQSEKSRNSRYIVQIQNAFYLLQQNRGKLKITHMPNQNTLMKKLGDNQSHYSPVFLDRHTLANSTLSVITRHAKADSVQVYYQREGNDRAKVFVVDEKGSIVQFTSGFHSEELLLQPLHSFLISCWFRQQAAILESDNSEDRIGALGASYQEPQYYEIVKGTNSLLPRIRACNFSEEANYQPYFPVQAIAEKDERNNINFNIYCDQHEFCSFDWGEELYSAVADFILAYRESNERYPCYITDLDISDATDGEQKLVQTAEFLRYKTYLESRLNNALTQA